MLNEYNIFANNDFYECCQAMGLSAKNTINVIRNTYKGLIDRGIINDTTSPNEDYEAMIAYLDYYSTQEVRAQCQ